VVRGSETRQPHAATQCKDQRQIALLAHSERTSASPRQERDKARHNLKEKPVATGGNVAHPSVKKSYETLHSTFHTGKGNKMRKAGGCRYPAVTS